MNLRAAATALVLPFLLCATGQAANQSSAYSSVPHTPGYPQPAFSATDPDSYRDTAAQMRQRHYWIELQKLRREGFELQKQDGGTLSAEHRAMLQAKLDHINATWR